MQYFFFFLMVPFLYFNYKIVSSDLRKKIIPNKYLIYLLCLVPLFYIYLIFQIEVLNIAFFLIQIFVTFVISFLLFYFGIWSAGDAKYLLVLSLFIPHIGIIPLIGNIALITLCYLILYFLYFYFIKNVFNKNYRTGLLINIKNDLKETFEHILSKENNKVSKHMRKKKIFKWILVFLSFFVAFRLIRIYILQHFLKDGENLLDLIQKLGNEYHIYFIFAAIIILFSIIYCIRFLYIKIIGYIKITLFKNNINIENVKKGTLLIFFIFLFTFIGYELLYNTKEITSALLIIFTLYIFLYILIKVLIYSYKITFGIAENSYIHISKLKCGEIVDKAFLIKLFGTQVALGFPSGKNNPEEKKKIFYPKPSEYLQNIENPIDEKNCKLLKKIYKIVNTYHSQQKTKGFQKIESIRVMNTFAFGIYIFIGFATTYIYSNKIFIIFITFIGKLLKSFYG